MRWLTNFYDFWSKWTPTAAIGIHPTKAWLSQLVNFKNAIWTSGYFRRTICNKKKMPQKRVECFRLLFLSDIKDSRKAGSLWGMMRGVEGVRKLKHQNWLVKGLGLGLLCWGLREFRKRFYRKRLALFKSGRWHFHQDNAPVHNGMVKPCFRCCFWSKDYFDWWGN